jgi:hypothetical protein
MKAENVLLIVGIGFIAYWLAKKPNKVIDIDPPMEIDVDKVEEPKTIVLDLNKTGRNEGLYPESMVKDYNASVMGTIAPPRTFIKEFF